MNICILGDSWGCGEWERYPTFHNLFSATPTPPLFPGRHRLLKHLGLEQFLLDDLHNVTNLSKGAGSNNDAVNIFKENLHDKYNYIFWFKTDPLRNCSPSYTIFNQSKLCFDDILNENLRQTEISYSLLNQFGVPIYCIGGAGKINVECMNKFDNLIPYIPSLTEFLLPGYKHPEIWCSAWYRLVGKKFDLESLDLLVACKKAQDSLINYKDLFWPDGKHPNRKAHEILYHKIKKDFNL